MFVLVRSVPLVVALLSLWSLNSPEARAASARGNRIPSSRVSQRGPLRVVYHPVRYLAQRRPSSASTQSKPYAATVTTVPAVLETPVAIVNDPDDGNAYLLNSQGSGTVVVFKVRPNGATSIFASIPVSSASAIAYDHATKSFYVTSAQSPSSAYPSVMGIAPNGTVTLVAGGSRQAQLDGKGAAAAFLYPTGIALDPRDGALYVADSDRVRRVTTSGVVKTTTAGGLFGQQSGFSQLSAAFNPVNGELYVSSPSNETIYTVSPAGAVKTLAGNCLYFGQPSTFSCDGVSRDGTGSQALFDGPSGIGVDPTDGSAYVADNANNTIRRIDLAGNVTTFAGNGITGELDGAGLNTEFDAPLAVTVDVQTRSLLVIDESNLGTGTVTLRHVTLSGPAAPPLASPIAFFDTVTPDAYPFAIDWHPSKAKKTLWYSEEIGRVASLNASGIATEYIDPLAGTPLGFGSLFDVAVDGSGTPWFSDTAAGTIDERTPAGKFLGAKTGIVGGFGGGVDQLAYGPDGNTWFGNGAGVDSITPARVVTQYPVTGGASTIAFASDGTLWAANGYSLKQLDLHGNILALDDYAASFVTTGPDGNVWFTQSDAIGTVKPGNVIVVYPIVAPIPGCSGGPPFCSRGIGAIAAGPDGALWVTEANHIGRLDPAGTFTEFAVPAAHSEPNDIVAGPDGNMWFVDLGAQKIGKLSL